MIEVDNNDQNICFARSTAAWNQQTSP